MKKRTLKLTAAQKAQILGDTNRTPGSDIFVFVLEIPRSQSQAIKLRAAAKIAELVKCASDGGEKVYLGTSDVGKPGNGKRLQTRLIKRFHAKFDFLVNLAD